MGLLACSQRGCGARPRFPPTGAEQALPCTPGMVELQLPQPFEANPGKSQQKRCSAADLGIFAAVTSSERGEGSAILWRIRVSYLLLKGHVSALLFPKPSAGEAAPSCNAAMPWRFAKVPALSQPGAGAAQPRPAPGSQAELPHRPQLLTARSCEAVPSYTPGRCLRQ